MLHAEEFIYALPDFKHRFEKWQETVNTMARIYGAPAAFVVQYTPKGYQVTIASDQETNPYRAGAIISPEINLFCRKVVSEQVALYVKDASQDSFWNDNPEVRDDGFRSYYGFPVRWPQGNPFGTICVMDFEPTDYATTFLKLMTSFRDLIEIDLGLVVQLVNKSELIAAMSHELRTPLNSIIGFSEILISEMFGPLGNQRYHRYAEDILNSGAHLLEVVNDLLDLSKAEVGRIELREEPFEVRAVVETCASMVDHLAAQAGVTVATELPGQLTILAADERRVRQVLLNLLSNAIKFSNRGGTVKLIVRPPNDHEGALSFEVRDQGPGMSAAELEMAMQPFGQVRRAGSTSQEGSGLGLPLAKSLVEQHGGRLTVDSLPGRGTTVTASFPRERVAG